VFQTVSEVIQAMNIDDDRRTFEEQGFIGPFKLWEPEVMRAFWKKQRALMLDSETSSRAIFDNPMNYDRHFDIPGLSSIISEPAIIRRMQALIGDDMLCWRTEIFPENPGDAGTGWHQVETFAIGENTTGVLEPSIRSENTPMELTAWIAFTEASRENGCMKLIPGSHRTWRYNEKARLTFDDSRKENTLFGYDYGECKIDPDWNPDDEEVAYMEMQPGEFIIFTARCIHGSTPNTSRKQRMGFAIRTVPPHVRVYGGMSEFNEFGHHFDLARHGCVLVAGQDNYRINTIRTQNEWGDEFRTLETVGSPAMPGYPGK